ncbi:S8 family serine peptidase [Saccharothrix sp. NRRL B-16348]|uniref:S8 family serine peptidase n=1 Tax=Saccharothrix sp. NRRL B-16348 TaxID=1415542 RepID=UPI001E54A9BE|nr:S8 family serine peptidase [Saccharothrix sp. NRRL B-16348]
MKKVWLDGIRKPSLDRSVAQIGAPTAWQAGYTGQGVKVAVLDSGVDQTHPDLAGQEVAERNFTDDPDTTDRVGHGTHVAATIASAGEKYRGVAPDARILDGKVCSLDCSESWILAGMQWAVDQGADVINVSLGGTDTPGLDPLEEAVNTLSAQSGTLFVIAAGNSGRPGTVGSPGSADAALTVGAVDRQDGIAEFSSRGPRLGDGAVKPDITAPGVDIVAAKAATGSIGVPVGDGHVAVSGTSMASPHVAGAAGSRPRSWRRPRTTRRSPRSTRAPDASTSPRPSPRRSRPSRPTSPWASSRGRTPTTPRSPKTSPTATAARRRSRSTCRSTSRARTASPRPPAWSPSPRPPSPSPPAVRRR